ncbi:MAG: DUF805 domain-containing protein [Deltaproteobacteria bacterium]|nr:DUF805 domain-containing protein [Deltaproteobacteria bacterium]
MLRSLFTFDEPVDRRTYAVTGFSLALVKLALDSVGFWYATRRLPTPFEALSPLLSTRESALSKGPEWLLAAMLFVTLPFLWVGVSMTVRRAFDAGRSPWLAMLFFIPLVNYVLIAVMCFLPSKPNVGWVVLSPSPGEVAAWRSALQGILFGLGLTWLMVGASVLVLGAYGAVLFLATPFLIGAAAAYLFNRGQLRGLWPSLAVVALSVILPAASLLLVALEGIICIAMALPIALVVGLLGGLMGRGIAIRDGRVGQLILIVAAFPILSGADSITDAITDAFTDATTDATTQAHRVRSVTTAIESDAPPQRVWANVVGFAEITDRPPFLYQVGVAYPLRATIEGEGVGAMRRCEFSTGAFVEPITVWDPPRHLAFSVSAQPPPMHEWSPYEHVFAPHLLTGLRSQRGEFRLTALPTGGTRLEGTTWYTLRLFPDGYWSLWSDAVIHGIHSRVLRHIRREAERS